MPALHLSPPARAALVSPDFSRTLPPPLPSPHYSLPQVDWTSWLTDVRVVALGLAEGLQQLHVGSPPNHPFVHNDVKPANTFLAVDAGPASGIKSAAVGDFGLAQDASLSLSGRPFFDTKSIPKELRKTCGEGVARIHGGSPIYM